MGIAVIAFVIALAIAAALTPLVRNTALRLRLVDQPEGRKIHTIPIPRLGGIAIVAAFYAPLLGLILFVPDAYAVFFEDPRLAAGLVGGGLAIAMLGVYDDLRGATALEKLTIQAAVALAMYVVGFRIEILANPFGAPIELGWIGLPLTLIWIVGVINALNLIDGLDGLAGGVALFALGVMMLMAVLHGQTSMLIVGASLAGAVFGFLFYNMNPATIFMGDSGSMFLGFVLATTALQTHYKSSAAVALLTPIIALGLPILDTVLAIARRAARGSPLFGADREHIHHRLIGLGLSQRQAALVLFGFCSFLGVSALLLTFANSTQTGLLLALLAVVTLVLVRKLGYFRNASRLLLTGSQEGNRDRPGALADVAVEIRSANDEAALNGVLHRFAKLVGAVSVEVVDLSTRPIGSGVTPARGRIEVEFPIPKNGSPAALVVVWSDDHAVGGDDETAAHAICSYLGPMLERFAVEREQPSASGGLVP